MLTETATKVSPTEEQMVRMTQMVNAKAAFAVNTFSGRLLAMIQSLFFPQWSDFERREVLVILLQTLCSFWSFLVTCKALQAFFDVQNFFLLLSLAGFIPFMFSLRILFMYIPCPKMAALVSNSALFGVFVILTVFGWLIYSNCWLTYVYVMTIWPWLAVASMVARLHIGRNKDINQFSPLFHLPVLGVVGVSTLILSLYALLSISLSDCLILSSLDVIWCGVLNALVFGAHRRKLHVKFIRTYVLLGVLILLYFIDSGSWSSSHVYFLLSRFLSCLRAVYVKWSFATVHNTKVPPDPPENFSIFETKEPPITHRFSGFPAPVLHRLDVIFDSGLEDGEYHAMGPAGTKDLFVLTEFTYCLPMASLFSWILEQSKNGTLKYGLFPPDSVPSPSGLVWPISLIFILAFLIYPWAVSRKLFDRGSSVSAWSSRPILLLILYFVFDVLYLNESISKFQIAALSLCLVLLGLYRGSLWTIFNRNKILRAAQELRVYQPSALRPLQKRTLLEFINLTSTDDFSFILLETSIRHGNNIKDLLKETSATGWVWDPRPSATAAWKLAASLVAKALRRQKKDKNLKVEYKIVMVASIRKTVLEIVDRAVDEASGHGERLILSGAHAVRQDKKFVFKELSRLVGIRKSNEKARKTGNLSTSLVLQATSGGAIRPVSGAITVPRPYRSGLNGLPSPYSVVICFGNGNLGQLGRNVADESTADGIVVLNNLRGVDFVQVQSGGSCSLAVTLSGNVHAWGSNRCLELGMREELRQIDNPTISKLLGRFRIIQISTSPSAVGQAHSLALTDSGEVVAFGRQLDGALGVGIEGMNRKQEDEGATGVLPRIIRLTSAVKIKQVCCGLRHSLLLDVDGCLWACGDNRKGQLGQGGHQLVMNTLFSSSTPVLVKNLEKFRIKFVACGDSHCLAAATIRVEGGDDEGGDERILSWGQNACGQLGNGNFIDQFLPGIVTLESIPGRTSDCGKSIISIAGGSQHSVVVTEGGKKTFTFGSDDSGQLGLASVATKGFADVFGRSTNSASSMTTNPFPSLVSAVSLLPNRKIVQAAAASSHTLLLDHSGEVLVFGDNRHGQLGFFPRSAFQTITEPRVISSLALHNIRYISTSDKHTICIAAENHKGR